ncbi:MAG: AAA family ATPase [Immundisolibacterales bacterium]|nr:AAA family ATPase [Immundisolibacterales bacterium]
MMETQHTHARFWKCALQVNPHGYSASYRGRSHGLSAGAYADKLLEVCRQEDIRVVGLADHGSVQDVDLIRDTLAPHGIVVFPGFEISSTEKTHMVCLFPEYTTTTELQRVLGRLDLMDPQERVTPSGLGCLDIARIVHDREGFWFAAHMTGNSGLLRLQQDGGGLGHVWKDHDLVRAGQIPGSVNDLPNQYKRIVQNKNPDYRRERPITVINAKDVAKPEDLADHRASTFIKMTRPCFASFLSAFKYPESRVRLHDEIQERFYSQIDSVRIEGGYFDGLEANFSGHLDAVIGGRGTGKSTLLECLRYALEVPHKAEDARKQGDQIVRENLGKEGGRVVVELRSATNNMERYRVIRRYGEPARVIDNDGNESSLRPGTDLLPGAEIYGQNEIYELARKPDELTRVLDRFLPQDAAQESDLESVRRKLEENGARLEKAHSRKDEIEARIAELPKLEERARQFKEQGLEEKLRIVPLLARERQLEPRMLQEVERVRNAWRRFEEDLPDLVFMSDKTLDGLLHAELLREGRQVLEGLKKTLQQKLEEIGVAVAEAEVALAPLVERLRKAMEESETDLEKEFASLPAMAGKTGREVGVAYQGLLREIEEIKPTRSQLKTVDALVDDLEQTRRNLLGEISDIRSKRSVAKQRAAKKLNKRLRGKLRITVAADGLRRPLRRFLQGLPNVGPQRTKWVDDAEGLTVLGLVAAIREGKGALLERRWGLTSGLADELTRLNASQLHELETIDIEDRVSIELNVSHSGPERFRALEGLSTGQQCTAILHLLLLDNRDPLIMDQPEDNLDNAFIAERIVRELLSAKTERQFLFATHNANIPVFGDAEWIGVCTATGDRAEMPPQMQGSIDVPEIRDHVAGILEGGKEAFTQRREMYGFDY